MTASAIDIRGAEGGDSFFAQVGAFLAAHRLSPEPAHYAFAYEVLTARGGATAAKVAQMTDGGFRLTAQDIAQLGWVAIAGTPVATGAPEPATAPAETDGALVMRALEQVAGFTATVRAMHAETNEFGRDLKASADAMRSAGPQAGMEQITQLTGAMIERVQRAESRLESAQREAAELREALDEARGSARTDPLTELPNRRAFDEAFAALDPAAAITVAICDIDHFKRINDGFGHAVGDRVLRAVAQTIAAEVDCTVARYGGEEFALLFEGIDAGEATERVDRARTALMARRLRERETDTPIGVVSFSAGIAAGCAADGQALLMGRADDALYVAKDAGRGRTILAP